MLPARKGVMRLISSREANVLDGVEVWAGYYRANPQRFAKDYLNVNLRLFQKILLFMMNISNFFCYIAARGWQTYRVSKFGIKD